ncbi:hypothetical protein PLUA15_90120 [Pseudomonas lundensis]|uniref:Uncharacterized protein n=1 Tax=Pseudomonas lundensis TaxID=86185 RepID=A0AAX2HH78_9PSED|nr:hypothetical protein PLUA15_90120 [Pseudomonas lundensis]
MFFAQYTVAHATCLPLKRTRGILLAVPLPRRTLPASQGEHDDFHPVYYRRDFWIW